MGHAIYEFLNWAREHDPNFEILNWIDDNVKFTKQGCQYKDHVKPCRR